MPNNGFFARFIGYTLAGILLVLFLHSFFYHYFPNALQLGLFPDQDKQESAEPRVVQARGNLAEDEKSTIELFENTRDSVVFITTRQRVMDAWTRNIFSVPSGTGSGFIWDDQGHIITNLHVVKGASEGEGLGPDLTTLKSRFQRADTLEAILDPSKTISDQYRGTVIVTANGQTITGLAAPQGDSVTVLQTDGTKVTLKKADIESQVASTVSPMPEKLIDELTLQEIADLFAYLESLR